ncbi:hypothetical protein BCR42DRAFT_420929, partial [Absidia repens]
MIWMLSKLPVSKRVKGNGRSIRSLVRVSLNIYPRPFPSPLSTSFLLFRQCFISDYIPHVSILPYLLSYLLTDPFFFSFFFFTILL